nr:HEAT repeat domain-containing protein [Candidatus Freyarchaeota archaeon]
MTGEKGTGSGKKKPSGLRRLTVEDVRAMRRSRDVDGFVEALGDRSSEVRAYAVMALHDIGGEKTTQALIRTLREDENSYVRWRAANALEIGDPRAVEPLIRALQEDEDYSVRSTAARVLGEIGDPRAVEPLIRALQEDEDWEVRESAAMALAEFEGDRVVEALIQALRDGESVVRMKAAWSLGIIGDARALEPLREAVEREESEAAIIKMWDAITDIEDQQEEVEGEG